MPILTYREAINQAMAEEMDRDAKVFLMGEEVAQYDGAYKVSQGLLQRFGPSRVIDSPISETGFAGLGVGAAMMGLRPIIEFMTWSFSYVAFDQVINNAANIRYMSGGQIQIPIVFRGPANGGVNVGATHSHTPEYIYASAPGLKVVCPATPYDAKGLMKAAIRDNDPVCVFENTILYNDKAEIPDEEYTLPLGVAHIERQGQDISLISYGRGVITSLEAASILASQHGIQAEVVNLRSLRPLDTATVLASVAKTHRVVVVDENKPVCGFGSYLASLIQAQAFDELDGPVLRVCALDAPQIYSMPLEKEQLPSAQRIVKTVLTLC
jgi:pyruvate dehydrogenase E1 component beta subunit